MYYDIDGTPINSAEANDKYFTEEARAKRNRRVGWTEHGGYIVSTVFLVINHSCLPGPPLLFETMIIRDRGPNDYSFEDFSEAIP